MLTVLEVQSPRSDILLDWLLLSMADGSTYGGNMCKNSLILNQNREREGEAYSLLYSSSLTKLPKDLM